MVEEQFLKRTLLEKDSIIIERSELIQEQKS